ncbi:MAG: O-antigen ligase family protein, partial [Planctomycetales bacterium]|nr:O-antigen ligase family protein [Planctomycetales bacterium]
MAKAKQRLKSNVRSADRVTGDPDPAMGTTSTSLPTWVVWCRRLAAGLLGSLVVYVAYYPSDSIQVENGDALWFCALALILWTMTMATEPIVRFSASPIEKESQSDTIGFVFGPGLMVDVSVWCLAAWMMVAALATCPPGNLRLATNEAWLWVAGAAILTSARRLMTLHQSRTVVISLMAAVAVGMSLHAMHQNWISLPEMRAEYLANPDKMLREAGMVAPAGSARRMVFANRLLDGGPTATFALANSLAAVLMIAVLVPIGVLIARRRSEHALLVNGGLGMFAIIAVAALFATRSRSAVAACALAVVWLWISGNSHSKASRFRRGAIAMMMAAFLGAVILVGVMVFGDDEWMSAAPASLQFRLQYWKATAQLLVDHPMMGAGPGGFQPLYLAYRLPVANETISDPHNFFFETLAAGGIPGGILLLFVMISCLRSRRKIETDLTSEQRFQSAERVSWIAYGAGGALALIWLFGLASGQLPDIQASLFSVPFAVFAGWLIQTQMADVTAVEIRRIHTAILFAMMTHLLVSGGWTVPGVALMIWLVVASICAANPVHVGGTSDALAVSPFASRASLGAFGLGVAILVCLRFESIVPTQDASLALLRGEDAMRRGMVAKADAESRLAVQADPWGFEAARWRSEMLRSQLITSRNDPEVRRKWIESIETVVDRAGGNPLVLRAVGEQCLHAYQAFGLAADLQRADRLISQALKENPTDLSLNGQASMIALQLHQREKAERLADETRLLSGLGNNIVQDLGLQQVMVVAKIGLPAANEPEMSSIKDQFRESLGWDFEPGGG